MDFLSIPQTAGVYFFLHKFSMSIYVGSSRKLRTRYKGHILTLEKGTHYNTIFQELWNMESEPFKAFQFGIFELVTDEDTLLQREQVYINEYLPTGTLMNISKSVGGFPKMSEWRRFQMVNEIKRRKAEEAARLQAEEFEKLTNLQKAKLMDKLNQGKGWELVVSYEKLAKRRKSGSQESR